MIRRNDGNPVYYIRLISAKACNCRMTVCTEVEKSATVQAAEAFAAIFSHYSRPQLVDQMTAELERSVLRKVVDEDRSSRRTPGRTERQIYVRIRHEPY